MTSGLKPGAPLGWGVSFDEYVRTLRSGPCVEAGDWPVEYPSGSVHSGRWALVMMKDACR